MILKRQTIWLLTMLTLMVVLSAYYLLTDKSEEIGVTHERDQIGTLDTGSEENGVLTGESFDSNDMGVDINTVQSTSTEDFFSSIRLNREQERDKMMEKYYSIVQTSSDKKEIESASDKMEQLDDLESSENTVESLIKSKGFADAVVSTINEKVEVTVQAESLKNEDVVSIIDLVAKHLSVPGVNVNVSYIH